MHGEDNSRIFWIIVLSLGIIIGIILSLLGPNMVHFVLFDYGDNFLVTTPFISNILVAIATVIFCIGCIGMLLERKLFKALGIIILLISFAFLYAGFTNYTIFSEEDITIRTPLSKDVYTWSDSQSASLVSLNEEKEFSGESIYEIQIVFDDGNVATARVNRTREGWRSSKIQSLLRQNGVNLDFQ